MKYQERLLRAIPGGAHTYSRGYDQFPSNAPEILEGGKGVHIFDHRGEKYLDYGMGIRAVNIGYAEDKIDEAAIKQIRNGTNLTRPSLIELQAAELLIDLIDSVDMVKFTKNGSSAVSAAVKLARAFTGRDLVARCAEQPFFSYDDWFIGSTPLTKGIPQETIEKTKTFKYNDVSSLASLIDQYPGEIACVILEPASVECPSLGKDDAKCCGLRNCARKFTSDSENYLQQVQKICKKNGIVFVLDEMITGFRWDMKGAQKIYGVKPDLCTFGKAMANGYAVACVAGSREIMQQGSIEFEGQERVFLLSSTHGAEMASLGAFVATADFMQESNTIEYLWDYGSKLISMMNRKAHEHGISSSFKVGGIACSPYYETLDSDGKNSLELRTLFSQEMITNGVLMPWISLAYRHTDEHFTFTERALDATFEIYKKAIDEGIEKYLIGPSIKPVFRKYN
jgi:glutamate-1-semialdehyde 2,1-aminomutase